MSADGRTEKSFRNARVGLIAQVVTVALSFVTRTVFIQYLGIEYLGVNALFTNILSVLGLAELGFGSAINYRLYKPLAAKDFKLVAALINLYARVYQVMGLVVTLIGLAVLPFIDVLIREDPGLGDLRPMYVLVLANSVLSYVFAHKRAVIIADQSGYVVSWYRLAVSVARAGVQISVLILMQSFIAYLVIQLVSTLLENLLVSKRSGKMFPFLAAHRSEVVEREERRSIWADVRALMIYRISSVALDGTDSILIAAFVGIAWVGKYSNYLLLVSTVSMLIGQITQSLVASIGNFVAVESRERQESLVEVITFVHFVIYGTGFICIVSLSSDFIALWVGPEYVISDGSVLVLAINWFLGGMLTTVWAMRTTLGLFTHGKYRPVFTAIINIGASIVLAQWLGLVGVLLGTTIARLSTNVWFDPLVVYRHGLKRPVGRYYLALLGYATVAASGAGLVRLVTPLIPLAGIAKFGLELIVCLGVAVGGVLIVYGRSPHYARASAVLWAMFRRAKW